LPVQRFPRPGLLPLVRVFPPSGPAGISGNLPYGMSPAFYI
jgi:hypothetical protein